MKTDWNELTLAEKKAGRSSKFIHVRINTGVQQEVHGAGGWVRH